MKKKTDDKKLTVSRAIKILRIARDAIAQPGRWCQKAFCVRRSTRAPRRTWRIAVSRLYTSAGFIADSNCAFCASGAVIAVMASVKGACVTGDADPVFDAMSLTIRLGHPELSGCLIRFNDSDVRTQEQVVEVFDATIARLKKRKPYWVVRSL